MENVIAKNEHNAGMIAYDNGSFRTSLKKYMLEAIININETKAKANERSEIVKFLLLNEILTILIKDIFS